MKHSRRFLIKQKTTREIKALEKEKLEKQKLNKSTVRIDNSLQKRYEKLKHIKEDYYNKLNSKRKFEISGQTRDEIIREVRSGNISENGAVAQIVTEMLKKDVFGTSKYDFTQLGTANDNETATEVGIKQFAQEVTIKASDLLADSKYRALFEKSPYMAILKAKNAAIRTKDISAIKSHIAINSEGKRVRDSEGNYVYELTSKAWWRGEGFFKNVIKSKGAEDEFARKANIKKSNIAYDLFEQKGTLKNRNMSYELTIFHGPNGDVYIVRIISDSNAGTNEGSNAIEFLSETEYDRKYENWNLVEHNRGYEYR